MRARTFVFALVCGTATAALAQDGGYVRFPSLSPQTCATACAGDQLCASWSFGASARSYGQSQTRSETGGMCTFSGSSVVRNSPGLVSGLPRRENISPNVPMMSSPPQQGFTAQNGRATRQSSGGGSGWDVRPAPWLNNSGRTLQSAPTEPMRGVPQQLRPVPPMPSATPSAGPRIDYEPQAPSQTGSPRPTVVQPSTYPVPPPSAPVYVPPTYATPPQAAPLGSAPVTSAPPGAFTPRFRPLAPVPPPGTREIPTETEVTPPAAAMPRPRPGSGAPRSRPAIPAPAPSSNTMVPDSMPSGSEAQIMLPSRAGTVAAPPSEGATIAPARRPSPARGTPRSTSSAAPSTGGAPPRQETAARPATGAGTPRAPVRDPSNPESFRGPDGMIDAAEMRRAQLNAARDQGAPAYSVQREWEAIAAETQRAEAAGEVRADPLAGTSPVPPPPETRAQRRAREAEEAAVAAEEARANAASDSADEQATQPVRPAPTRGARGVPRPKTPARSSQNDTNRQVAELVPQGRAPLQRRAPAQALDREPRLSGGPGN